MPRDVIIIDAAGVAHPLNLEWQASGRYMPPVTITDQKVPEIAGSRLRSVRHEARELTFAIYVEGDLPTQEAALRQLVHWFDPRRGDIRLRNTAADGTDRDLTCRYESGLDLDETLGDMSSPTLQRALVTVRADDPYWYDTGQESAAFSPVTSSPVWFDGGMILPIKLGSSAVFGGTILTIDSDVDIWPRWTITGPGTALVITNLTTGREFAWGGTLTGGQQLLIDTTPGVKTVLRENGSNQFGAMTEWDLWPFVAGDNHINVSLTGTSGASLIAAAWRNAHLAP